MPATAGSGLIQAEDLLHLHLAGGLIVLQVEEAAAADAPDDAVILHIRVGAQSVNTAVSFTVQRQIISGIDLQNLLLIRNVV